VVERLSLYHGEGSKTLNINDVVRHLRIDARIDATQGMNAYLFLHILLAKLELSLLYQVAYSVDSFLINLHVCVLQTTTFV
jgi:hypothetical protein